MVNKITVGFVIQSFDEKGKCFEQTFVAGDQVDFEGMNGEVLSNNDGDYDNLYYPFAMEQPQ